LALTTCGPAPLRGFPRLSTIRLRPVAFDAFAEAMG
jgi:hypothetical protein